MNKTGFSNPLYVLSQACLYVAAIYETTSFTRAAEHLGVQQSAVSHRIKQLEERLGYRLYERTTRTLIPTEAGEILGNAASSAISEFERALQQIENRRSSPSIRLSVSSSLAMKWLVPRLGDAMAEGLDISLLVQEEQTNLKQGEADAVIRFGTGPFPGLHSARLAKSYLQAVVSPAFRAQNALEDNTPWSAGVPLLGDKTGEKDGTGFSWNDLAAAEGRSDPILAEQYFDRADIMLQAAISGSGIGLGRTLLIESDISNGFLEKIGPSVPMKASYWLLCTHETAKINSFQKLEKWLHSQIKEPHSA